MNEDWEALYNELADALNKTLDKLGVPQADLEGDFSLLRLIFLYKQIEMERRDAMSALLARGYDEA